MSIGLFNLKMSWRTSREFWRTSKMKMKPSWKCNANRRKPSKHSIKRATMIKRYQSWMKSSENRRSNWENSSKGTVKRRKTWSISMSSWSCWRKGAAKWYSSSRIRRKRDKNWRRRPMQGLLIRVTLKVVRLNIHRKSSRGYSYSWRRQSKRR